MRGKAWRAGAVRDGRRRGTDDPAGGGGGAVGRRRCAQQQRQRAALSGGEREPPHCDPVDCAGAHFADHDIHGAAAQGFFHAPQQVAAMRGAHRHQSFGGEAEGIEAGAMRHAAFGARHVLGNPENASAFAARRQAQGKCGGRSGMGFRRGCNFMQGPAHEAATKHRVDRGNAKGQHAGAILHPGWLLQGLKALAKLCDHH